MSMYESCENNAKPRSFQKKRPILLRGDLVEFDHLPNRNVSLLYSVKKSGRKLIGNTKYSKNQGRLYCECGPVDKRLRSCVKAVWRQADNGDYELIWRKDP